MPRSEAQKKADAKYAEKFFLLRVKLPLDEKTVSPNGAWALVNREHNLWLLGRSGEKRLTADGAEKM